MRSSTKWYMKSISPFKSQRPLLVRTFHPTTSATHSQKNMSCWGIKECWCLTLCSKYADMLNDDRTLFQNPSCAIIVWIPGRSGTIFNYQFLVKQRNLKDTCSSNCCLRCDTLTCLPVSHTKSIGAQAYDPYPKWDRTSLVTGWCCGPRWEHWEHRLMILFQKLDFCLQLLNHLLFEFSETKKRQNCD